jgi:peptidoglycan/LPS O-acetylase OafA/YrhL
MKYHLAVGYLRAFIILLVVLVHSFTAYLVAVPPPAASLLVEPRLWALFPVVDRQRWAGASLLMGFGDTCFIALFFFLSGLFVWHSLTRQGSAAFLRERFLRLGLPFLAAALLAPLAYYPAYLQTGAKPSLTGFGRQWLALGNWWAGPAWFVWVLLAFDVLAAACFLLLPRSIKDPERADQGKIPGLGASFVLLVAVSAAAFIPLLHTFGPLSWTGLGPFFFQTSRPLLYAVYFAAGIVVGRSGIDRGWLGPGGQLARHWLAWSIAALVAYDLVVIDAVLLSRARISLRQWETLGGLAFVLCCAASGFALFATFLRFATQRAPLFDNLARNSYGIYLVHIIFVTWLQYALLAAPLHAAAKGSIVFIGALALSWLAISSLRRLPGVARVI